MSSKYFFVHKAAGGIGGTAKSAGDSISGLVVADAEACAATVSSLAYNMCCLCIRLCVWHCMFTQMWAGVLLKHCVWTIYDNGQCMQHM